MRALSVTAVSALLFLYSDSCPLRSEAQTLTNATEQLPSQRMTISVFFDQRKIMGADELRLAARKALAEKGHVVENTLPCVVNVSVGGKKPGCAVLFQDLKRDKIYVVQFSSAGGVSSVFAGTAREGVPPKGWPPPKLPEGGVPIDPRTLDKK